jgi:UDP-N-acetyl-2-amino-2-deoxyglucuronate dehydrogenase
MMKNMNFALTGVAGYIAPRHLQAIKETGNLLIAAVDPHDSVGIIDRYFPDAAFFTEFERFDRHLEMLRRKSPDQKADFISICAPNNLHDAHIRLALRIGADALCEKPLVLNPWNLDTLQSLEEEFGKRIYTVLQLRVHPDLIRLREKMMQKKIKEKYKVRLTYITSRGKWYHYSWKGDENKSGGIATNIGVHFFDLLIWFFGNVTYSELHLKTNDRMAGFLTLNNADVEWYLSINKDDLPKDMSPGQSTYRSLTVDDDEIEFSGGFTDLHTRIYEETINGRGFDIDDARPSIKLVHDLRHANIIEPSKIDLTHLNTKKILNLT